MKILIKCSRIFEQTLLSEELISFLKAFTKVFQRVIYHILLIPFLSVGPEPAIKMVVQLLVFYIECYKNLFSNVLDANFENFSLSLIPLTQSCKKRIVFSCYLAFSCCIHEFWISQLPHQFLYEGSLSSTTMVFFIANV
jgi:hypothetical protein